MTTITTDGVFRFASRIVHFSKTLSKQKNGMEATDDGRWAVDFQSVLLATFATRDDVIQR